MSANDRQEGGTHYKTDGKPQHWDLVLMYDWDYFQGQITKYLMRWKTKHSTPEKRLEDLKKARHFLDKYIENAAQFGLTDVVKARAAEPLQPGDFVVQCTDASLAIQMARDWEHQFPDEFAKWQNEGYYGDGTSLWRCRTCREQFRGAIPPKEHKHE